MKTILLYNTLGRKKEEFQALEPGKLSFYYCGPTVYWTQHIGNLRGLYCADIIYRTFKYLNYEVNMVRNYTDVGHLSSDDDFGEDKIEKTAKKDNLSPEEISAKFIEIFERDARALNILEPRYKPRATENISEMIEMIQLLIAKGYAYATDLAIYFRVNKFPDYNELSGRNLLKDRAGAGQGMVSDAQKEDFRDFALWFFRAGEHQKALQFWPSPFFSSLVNNGEGFPGWHLECSVMAKKFLGETIDLHMGGVEHISIHHSNEIAQSESANGVKFVNYWLHNEHLLYNNTKMSKSQGMAFTLSELESKGFSPMALRFFYLQAHYRSVQNFTFEALKASQKGLSSLLRKLEKIFEGEEIDLNLVNLSFRDKFLEYLLDDFNVSKTLSLIPEILKADLSNQEKLATILSFDSVWGLSLNQALRDREGDSLEEDSWPEELKAVIEERIKAKEEKNFQVADDLRKKIEAQGYQVQDLPENKMTLKKKEADLDSKN